MGVFLGHDGHRWAANVACADAGDGSNLFLNHLGAALTLLVRIFMFCVVCLLFYVRRFVNPISR